jgi:hypothetical protein
MHPGKNSRYFAAGGPSKFVLHTLTALFSVVAAVATAQADDLSGLIDQARQRFIPVTESQLSRAKNDLKASMGELERFVQPSSTNGQRWLKYLHWDDLKKGLESNDSSAMEPINDTYQRLNRDENGLELPQFRRVSEALQRYGNLLASAQSQNPEEDYAKQLDGLSKALDAYLKTPTTANELSLAGRLNQIAAIGQAPELVAELRREVVQPNAFIDVSAELLSAGAEPIDRHEPVTDYILGTRVQSQAHTRGTASVATLPADDRAVHELQSRGHTESSNYGTNGPAIIRSTGHTDYTARKRVELTDKAFRPFAAEAHATTNTDFHSVG